MTATWDDISVQWDDPAVSWDGAVTPAPPGPPTPPSPPFGAPGTGISAHDLLTPQVILNRGVPAGSQWSKEEGERWEARARKTRERDTQPIPRAEERDADRQDEEAIALLLSILL